MEMASKLIFVIFLICATVQAYSIKDGVERRATGLHSWDEIFTNTNDLHRRQDYGKNPVNWEQIWKLKALLDQVGRRK